MSNQPVDRDDEERRDADERKKRAQPEVRQAPESGPTFAAGEPRVLDLSKEIVKMLPKAVGERVTCRRISGNHYRCNWWSPHRTDEYDNPQMAGLMVTTHRVTRSELLHVTMTAKGLSIEAATGGTR